MNKNTIIQKLLGTRGKQIIDLYVLQMEDKISHKIRQVLGRNPNKRLSGANTSPSLTQSQQKRTTIKSLLTILIGTMTGHTVSKRYFSYLEKTREAKDTAEIQYNHLSIPRSFGSIRRAIYNLEKTQNLTSLQDTVTENSLHNYFQEILQNNTTLPPGLLQLILYGLVPQESFGDTKAKSHTGALGLWQIVSGKKKELMTRYNNGKNFNRYDPITTTEICVKDFERVYKRLQKSDNWKTIQKQTGLQEEPFLWLCLLTQRNAGENNMLGYHDDSKDIHITGFLPRCKDANQIDKIKNYLNTGKTPEDIFHLLAHSYKRDGKDGREKEIANYPLYILSKYRYIADHLGIDKGKPTRTHAIDYNNHTHATDPFIAQLENDRKSKEDNHALQQQLSTQASQDLLSALAITSGGLYLGNQTRPKKKTTNPTMSRRGFLSFIAGAGVGAGKTFITDPPDTTPQKHEHLKSLAKIQIQTISITQAQKLSQKNPLSDTELHTIYRIAGGLCSSSLSGTSFDDTSFQKTTIQTSRIDTPLSPDSTTPYTILHNGAIIQHYNPLIQNGKTIEVTLLGTSNTVQTASLDKILQPYLSETFTFKRASPLTKKVL